LRRSLQGEKRNVALEVARLYELMSRMYFYSNETVPVLYSAFRFLNEAEKAGTSAELAIAYASMAVTAGFAQLHPLAESYVQRALAVAKEVDQPSNIITVNVVTGAYKLAAGKWEEVRQKALQAKAISEELGDYRQWGDSVVLAAESALISSDLAFAMQLQQILLEDARRRRSPLHQGWALFGVAANNIRLGNAAAAVPMLEEALQILEEIPNIPSSINTNGTIALAHLRLDHNQQALLHAGQVLKLAENLSPTVYSLNIGFSAVAEVYFRLWESALQDRSRKLNPEQLQSSALKAIKLVRAFEKVFPIGQPSTPYYQGWYEWLAGDKQKAVRLWNKSLEASQRFRMLYEEGLARVKLGTAETEADLRAAHLKRAIEIFETMKVPYELGLAKEIARRLQ
jgi:tetratricopeptide (TPR) repeat protein